MPNFVATNSTGRVILAGETVKDFRQQEWTFRYASRPSTADKDGKIVVVDEFNRTREFYASVFGFFVEDNVYEECPRGCGYQGRADYDRGWKIHFECECPLQPETEFSAE